MTILIVDDSSMVRSFLHITLCSEGYDVVGMETAEAALDFLFAPHHAQSTDLILMDLVLPGQNGIDATKELKNNEFTCDIPVIMITSVTDTTLLDDAFSAGAVDYIVKPIKTRELLARIRSSLLLKKEMDARKKRERELVLITQQLEEAVKRLNDLSMLDGLTEIANRRRFDEYLTSEWLRAKREQTSLALVMVDIDFFKNYNDAYGHLAGDECLKAIAATLRREIKRSTDLACRYGGEEFSVILPNTDAEGAEHIGRCICQAVREQQLPHRGSLIEDHVTVSVGVACTIPGGEERPESLITRADQALYHAKKSGRNQVSMDR
ncbi:diguanylate cyclase domain-containing protein [Heliophilum fasciatum]|uniref:Stage 0 sporulation protein A homolog n=1 Tax=Heliophilum fasciatum TaxID=35700 RepID=A0A4R2RKH9_9FIRM|nr:diguanylate cyclase [Heliophilum fasciatum]MCW2277978.1 diguanylate cyclase (GGDEF)-like protein [Heliophilum fasciatum]TCP64402.1 response regulator receiver modulated diguanylate cyclase [Heliophilum fasciatum]